MKNIPSASVPSSIFYDENPMQASELRPIQFLSAAGRCAALDPQIPSVFGDSWTLAADQIRYFSVPVL
ncbi:Hypothetical protein FKW44_014846 [Caligus rogercresseyi]|uniref:Uncharacterized protein n=1 Tax=Caligus rogercresseyi TaxID=217165 RepID=A0A7T8K067_CALRO|nr:Hypothetical protein FKW44_014846 [Caligus rogercresseyi]